MEHETSINLDVGQHLEETLADEDEERRLDCESDGDEVDISSDLYHMNITNRDLNEANIFTEVNQGRTSVWAD